ncbi:NRDE family protein [Rhodovibrionaceae bacterium A322]
MCTIVLLRRPGHSWPLLFAGNRDEMADRAWQAPGRHWTDRPDVTAGRDDLSGGSWLGVNDHGVMAVVLNRWGTLGPADGKRSRGELVLDALDFADAKDAAEALQHLNASAFRGFNLVIADNRDAYWLRNQEDRGLDCQLVPEGLSMMTAFDMNDIDSARIGTYLQSFEEAAVPQPDPLADKGGDWQGWQRLLASTRRNAENDPGSAMTVDYTNGFRTVSSALIALPAPGLTRNGTLAKDPMTEELCRPVWLFASDRPDQASYERVEL